MLAKAREKHPKYTFYQVDMNNLADEEAYSNIVSMFGSISYADCTEIYEKIFRALRPKGRFYLMVYNDRIAFKDDHILNKKGIRVPWHTGEQAARMLLSLTKLGLEFKHVGFNYCGSSLENVSSAREIGKYLLEDLEHPTRDPLEAFFSVFKGERTA
jgi:SAM-dependent methyltransferase